MCDWMRVIEIVDNWSPKALRRRTQGTGRLRYLKTIPRLLKNGFRTGVQTPRKQASN